MCSCTLASPYFVILLAEKDTCDVYREVIGLAGRWSSLCLALRILPSDRSTIEAAHRGNPHECLQACSCCQVAAEGL